MMLTTSSGAEVPNATMVSPMAKSETLNFLASDDAPFTIQLAPNIRQAKPNKTRSAEIVIFFSEFSAKLVRITDSNTRETEKMQK
jgi:hypothetical protein